MIKVWKLRPFNGRLSANVRSTTVLTVADSVFTSGAPPSTVMLSVTDPTVISMSISAAPCTWRMTSGLINFLNPFFSISNR
jgi:hypothetical protein